MPTLSEMIPRRRSVRSYLPTPVPADLLSALSDFMAGLAPLIPGARVEARIISTDAVNFLQKWATPHALAIFAEDTDDALLNVGFMFQQVDLYLQSCGLGSCWVGLGWLKDASQVPKGMRLAAVMPFGWPDHVPLRTGAPDFKRKSLVEISDLPDERLEPARLAPSATNSQSWIFTHDGKVIHVWREQLGRVMQRTLGKFNPIDVGIALAHLSLTSDAFTFRRLPEPPAQEEGLLYIGTITL